MFLFKGISFLLGLMVLVGLIHDLTKDDNRTLANLPPAILLSVFLRLATFVSCNQELRKTDSEGAEGILTSLKDSA